jgi:flagellar basal-body rod protein FlgF
LQIHDQRGGSRRINVLSGEVAPGNCHAAKGRQNLAVREAPAISLFGSAAMYLRDFTPFFAFWHAPCNSLSAMDPLTAIAASGLRSRMESLEMLANNLANAGTAGYKTDREFYSLYLAPEANTDATMPLIDRPWTDFSQGLLRDTGNPLDLALTGKGFFTVNGPGGPLYTRNGSFRLSPKGALVTAEGYPVRGVGGTTVNVPGLSPLEISKDGTVRQDGNIVGQLEILDFTSAAGLAKQGNSYFRADSASPRTAMPPDAAVHQGHLEDSNSGSAEAAVRLIGVMRQFEALQKAVSLGGDMNQQAIQEVARVAS